MKVFDELKARGLVAQTTGEAEVSELINNGKAIFYNGFDPTADSLTVGHYVPLILFKHLQKAGNKPIVLIGGGTTMVGDPTDKTGMRTMMTREQISSNAEKFKEQMTRFIDFSDDKAIMLNNADWLLNLNYVDFLRDIGVHFSVNRMLAADCYKSRMENGLSFLEFNYMLMQAFDFYYLHDKFGCNLQCGGDDQWANQLAGTELIRRKLGHDAHTLTLTLLLTSEGQKMGKTAKGALWLDPNKTSPYDFYQYFRNTPDADTVPFLRRMTFVPLEEIAEMEKLEGQQLNAVKERLAMELTTQIHGEEEAKKAREASKALFSIGGSNEDMPTSSIAFEDEISVIDAVVLAGLLPSKSEARRLIEQNGLEINGEKVTDIAAVLKAEMFQDGGLIVKKGKKTFHKLTKS